jgi:carboxypeptidase PM20D1
LEAIAIAIVAVLLVLAAAMLLNAVRLKPMPAATPLPLAAPEDPVRSVQRFQAILRCATVWGAEEEDADRRAFEEFLPLLRQLYPLVFERLELSVVNGYGIMLRWPGADAGLAPIVLMAHYDVVSAEREAWSHDPFAAEIADGRIWARGAIDTKCILSALLEATEALLMDGHVPPRDVYLCSSNCEEDGGSTVHDMIAHLLSQGKAPYLVIDEGGGIIDDAPLGVTRPVAAIGVAEKGFFNAFVTVNAKGGHSATPRAGDSTNKLVHSLHSLATHNAPARLNAATEAMLKELAAMSGFGLRLVMANLWLLRPLVLRIMRADGETAAMVRTTYALTELEGARAANIIPTQAKAAVNVRVDPNETVEVAFNRLKTHFDAQAEFSLEGVVEPSPISPFNDEAFNYLRSIIGRVYPEAGVIPYVQSSRSDAGHFSRVCPHTYRFAGFFFRGSQRSAIHGVDENIDVESYIRGIGFYIELIRNFGRLGEGTSENE